MLPLAAGLVADDLNVIAVARKLKGFRDGIEPEIARLLDVFAALDSETDALPIGKQRAMWSEEALARLDSEKILIERRWQDRAVAAATQIVRLLESSS